MKKIVLSFLFLLMMVGVNFAVSLDVSRKISSGVFEIVIPKMDYTKYEYDKQLPFDLLPFHIRNDKYRPIGTAFLLDDDVFVTAAHVLGLLSNHQRNEYYIRDGEGNVYLITSLLKYSQDKDFAVFTVDKKGFKSPFKIKVDYDLNATVYAVGNALGDGIVTREGLLTSTTPEELEGVWKWLRFSAAASPGNSGGPLLDENGNVLGIVVRKSMNENLNYALPVQLALDFPDNTASAHSQFSFKVTVMDESITDIFDFKQSLPLTPFELKEKFYESFSSFYFANMDRLVSENRGITFPNAKGSEYLLSVNDYDAGFPKLIAQGGNKQWTVFHATEPKRVDLEDNGVMTYGDLGGFKLAGIRVPDSVHSVDLMDDPVGLHKILLKSGIVVQQVMHEKVMVNSLGEPFIEEEYEDSLGRKWKLWKWHFDYYPSELIVMALPTPDGLVVLFANLDSVYDVVSYDFKDLTTFLMVDYFGSISQWEKLLNSEYCPNFFEGMRLEKSEKEIRVETDFSDFSVTSKMLNISDESAFWVGSTYSKNEEGEVVYTIKRMGVYDGKTRSNMVGVTRSHKPFDGAPEGVELNWEKIRLKRYPYNYVPFHHNGRYLQLATIDNKSNKDVVYVIVASTEDQGNAYGLGKRLKRLKKGLTIHEFSKK